MKRKAWTLALLAILGGCNSYKYGGYNSEVSQLPNPSPAAQVTWTRTPPPYPQQSYLTDARTYPPGPAPMPLGGEPVVSGTDCQSVLRERPLPQPVAGPIPGPTP